MSLHSVKSVLSIVAVKASNKILNCLWGIYLQQKTRAGVNSNSFGLREKGKVLVLTRYLMGCKMRLNLKNEQTIAVTIGGSVASEKSISYFFCFCLGFPLLRGCEGIITLFHCGEHQESEVKTILAFI